MMLAKQLFTLVLFLCLLLLPGAVLAVGVGEPAPDFSLKTLDGQAVSLSDFAGQVVLLKLATTWCPTCKQLSAEIGKVDDFLAAKKVVVLEVFVQDSPEMIARYLKDKDFSMTYHSLVDDGQAYRAYNVYLIPRLVVVDPKGLVTFDSAGQNVDAARLQELVVKALPTPPLEQEAPATEGL